MFHYRFLHNNLFLYNFFRYLQFDDKLFYATMINKERFDQIQKWIKESNN